MHGPRAAWRLFSLLGCSLIAGGCGDTTVYFEGALDGAVRIDLCMLASGEGAPREWENKDPYNPVGPVPFGKLRTWGDWPPKNTVLRRGMQLAFPKDYQGEIRVYGEGVDSEGCVIGTADLTVRRTDGEAALQFSQDAGRRSCRLAVKANGPGRAAVDSSSQPGAVAAAISGGRMPAECELPYLDRFPEQTEVTLRPVADPNAHFTGWTSCDSEKGTLCTTKVRPGEQKVEVSFSRGLCTTRSFCWENPLPQGNALRGAWGSAQGELFVVGDYGTLLHRDRAEAGFVAELGTSRGLKGVSGTPFGKVWVVGEAGEVRGWDRATNQWESPTYSLANGARPSWFGVAAESPPYVHVVGQFSELLVFNGTKWDASASNAFPAMAFHSVWGNLGGKQYAVGDTNFLLESSGPSWQPISQGNCGPKTVLRGVWGQGSQLWAGGEDGSIQRFKPNEVPVTCVRERMSGPSKVISIAGDSADSIWALQESGALLSRGSDTSWSELPSDQNPAARSGQTLHALAGVSGVGMYAVGSTGVILRRAANPGSAWELDPSVLLPPEARANPEVPELPTRSDLQKIAGRSATEIWAVASDGSILRWNGQVWRVDRSAQDGAMHAIWVSGSDVWAGGDNGRILLRRNDEWTVMDAPALGGMRFAVRDITGSADRILIVGDGSLIASTPAAGEVQWKLCADAGAVNKRLNAAWAIGSDVVIVGASRFLGDPSVLIWNLECNSSMKLELTKENLILNDVFGNSLDDVWAVGSQRIMRRVGGTWSIPSFGDLPGVGLFGVHGTKDEIWFVGEGGRVWRYDNASGSFGALESGTGHDLRGVWALSSSAAWLVGASGTILRYTP